MSWNILAGLGSLYVALGVGAGAFGAHALKEVLSPERLASFEVGVRYQIFHGLALILLGLITIKIDTKGTTATALCFLLGTILFSGSIYGLCFDGPRWLGPITPMGGSLLILGWLTLSLTLFLA